MNPDSIRLVQEEAARVAAILGPKIAEITEALAPAMETMRIAAANGIDLEVLQNSADAAAKMAEELAPAIETLRIAADQTSHVIDPEVLQQSRDAAAKLAEHYETMAAYFGQAYAVQALAEYQEMRRLTENLQRRWGRDFGTAESILRSFMDYKEDVGPRFTAGPHLAAEDAAIAGLYYFQELTQEEIGLKFGLSQPSIANRLNKIDKTVAHHVLVQRISQIAENEGWELAVDGLISSGSIDAHFDIAVMKPRAGALGIELYVVNSTTRWMPLAERMRGWTEYLALQQPSVYRAHALYDMSTRKAYLCVDVDLERAAWNARRHWAVAEKVRFGDIYMFLPESLSLNNALERAKSSEEAEDPRDSQ